MHYKSFQICARRNTGNKGKGGAFVILGKDRYVIGGYDNHISYRVRIGDIINGSSNYIARYKGGQFGKN